MAVTKILARRGGLAQAIAYVVNGDKTEEQVLTAAQGCSLGSACAEMQDAKIRWNKTDGVQLYHIIQSFRPGEITPGLALEIAQEFVREHLPGYQAVIGIHTDRDHIHAHIVFNSVNQLTGEKYHSNARSYYQQIRGISDRLCREHGLSVIMTGEPSKAVSYIEWLRQSKGQPTFRSMLEADLRTATQDANDLGHFFLLMEHMGYEIRHGDRLGFRLRGQERFMYPGRRDPLFTEDGIRAAIQGNLAEIEAGHRPAVIQRPKYRPYRKHGDGENPVVLKSEFLLSLCEQLIGAGKLSAKEKSVIDRCTAQVYRDYIRSGYHGAVPTLQDFHAELLRQPEKEAQDVALAIELFTDGSLNTFAKPTNVDTNARILCYDIRDLVLTTQSPSTAAVLPQPVEN